MFGREHGSRAGMSGMKSDSQANLDRRERLRQLALEKIDLAKDPYFFRNHLGSYECKLCLTLHQNEGSYLAHTQGKRHQQNIARRAAKDLQEKGLTSDALPQPLLSKRAAPTGVRTVKIGRPGYKVTKQKDPETGQRSLLFEVQYPRIEEGMQPRYRFMSAFEQHVEPPDKNFQYLLFAAEPYETIAFKIPNKDVERDTSDRTRGRFITKWDAVSKVYTLQVHFKLDKPAPTTGPMVF
eukprot:m51a1_g3036 putative splicing factor 3a subunit 2-like (238) ;mRNA; f:914850-915688